MATSAFTHADGSCRGKVFAGICLSVYLHDISKTAAARITKRDTDMFHHEAWKLILWEKGKDREAKNSGFLHSCECWLLHAGLGRRCCIYQWC